MTQISGGDKYSETSQQRTPTGLKKLFVIKRSPLLGGILTKIATFRTKHFVRYSRHVRYLGCPLLGAFTVFGPTHALGQQKFRPTLF